MKSFRLWVLPQKKMLMAEAGQRLIEVIRCGGIQIDAPCGGRGLCGKCKIIINGKEQLACRVLVTEDMTIEIPEMHKMKKINNGLHVPVTPDGCDRYVLAFDIGTTTVVGSLFDGVDGRLMAQESMLNPQVQYGADVISRIQYVLENKTDVLKMEIRHALASITMKTAGKAQISAKEITKAAIVCNTAMHHLLLGIDPKPLTIPPYSSDMLNALELPSKEILPISEQGMIRFLPNIAGFIGSDTVGCLVSTRLDQISEPVLLIDIGTNGEMVLKNGGTRIACSTAAGPAFEGGNIRFGMRGTKGAVSGVHVKDGHLDCEVIGNVPACGICGSGLLDAVYVFLKTGIIDSSGKLNPGAFCEDVWIKTDGKSAVEVANGIFITQKDIREVQLAKAAIRAGIELMAIKLGIELQDIRKVYLAGAFGSCLSLKAACGIGMLPSCLRDRTEVIGNAAGEGAKLCALKGEEYEYSKTLAAGTQFLELASMVEFQEKYVDAMSFPEKEG